MNLSEHKKAMLLNKLSVLVKECPHLAAKVDCVVVLDKMLVDTSNKYAILWGYLKDVSPTKGLSYEQADAQLTLASVFCAYMNMMI